ncbi:VWFA domain-containing protein [Entamoeba marina]
MSLFFSFFFLSIAFASCDFLESGEIYSVQEAYDCIESVEISDQKAKEMLNDVKSLFEVYVYKDILKYELPNNKYYQYTVDIDEGLENINTTNRKIFYFFREFWDIIKGARDLHLSFRLSSNAIHNYVFDNFYAVLPFKFVIDNDETHAVRTEVIEEAINYGYEIPEEFNLNNKEIIKTINGLEPLEFLREYSDLFLRLKSEHGTFTYMMETHPLISLGSMPFMQYELPEFDIEYENGSNVTGLYKMYYLPTTNFTSYQQKRILPKIQSQHYQPLMHSDFFEKVSNGFGYKYESSDNNVACGLYTSQSGVKLNVFVLVSFMYDMADENNTFIETLNNCFEFFDTNNYQIEIILPLNGGGIGDVEADIENAFAPHSDVNLYGSVRESDDAETVLKMIYASLMADPETCEHRREVDENTTIDDLKEPLGPWYDEPITDYYGETAHVRSQPSVMPPGQLLTYTTFTKNPRKPTDIVVMTDGFCYSCCSLLTKGFLEKGTAILVGFSGDPEGPVEEFDSGISPTAVITSMYTLSESATDLAKKGGSMSISFFETYSYNYYFNDTIPREFIKSPVMERVDIYAFNEDTISLFVEEGIKILDKYQTYCDVNNTAMVFVDDNCDASIKIEHAHGGHPCVNGLWDLQQCVPSYCDEGYKWDRNNNICIVDTCYAEESSSSQESSSSVQESSSSVQESSSSVQESSSSVQESSSSVQESSSSVQESSSSTQESSSSTQESSSSAQETSESVNASSSGEPDKGISPWIWVSVAAVIILVALVILGAGILIFFILRKGKSSQYNLMD